MKHSVIFAGLGILLLAGCAGTEKPQEQSSLAVLPFMGIDRKVGETLATLLIDDLQNNFKVIPRTFVINSIRAKEQEFQRSDVTDLDTIAAIGKELNADFVVAGYIQSFQGINLLFINIMDIKTLQLVAGDYKQFKNIESISALLPVMAKKIVKAPKTGGKSVRELAVLPFIIPGVSDQEAETLAQIAAIEVVNSGNYAVLPRTQAIKQVMAEQQIQRSNLGELNNIQSIGKAINAQYVLAGQAGDLGKKLYFSLQIVNLEKGDLVRSSSAEYQVLTQGLDYIPLLSQVISGQKTEAQKKQAINQKQKQAQHIPDPPEGLKYVIADGSVTITKYSGNNTAIVIPTHIKGLPVTAIGNGAFYDCRSLTSVSIPDSVTAIEENAFSQCNSLSSIGIPKSTVSIGNYAFSGCSSLSSVSIPNSVTSIGNHAFYGCSRLNSVGIPASVISIGGYAFYGCSRLSSIGIPVSVTIIGERAFYGCTSLTGIDIPNSVISIGEEAFYECNKLTGVTLSKKTKVGAYTFPYKVKLTYRED